MKTPDEDMADAEAFFNKVWLDGAPVVTASAKAVFAVMARRMYLAGVKSGIDQMAKEYAPLREQIKEMFS